MTSWATVWAQQVLTLTLSDRDPTGAIGGVFDGNILQVGSQYGGASIFAKFGGSGTRSFTVYSPGDGRNINTVTADGFFNFKPNGSMTFDRTKILNFSGSSSNISGSVAIRAVPMSINTYSVISPDQVTPGVSVTIRYQINSSGTFPDGLKFIVELRDANDAFLKYLPNPVDINNGSEAATYTQGSNRTITATIPGDQASGTYRVRVVTSGLNAQAPAASSAQFTIGSAAQVVTQPTSINVTSVCPGGQIILSANVTDDGLLGVRENANDGGKYWVSYYNASTGQLALDFQTYNEEYTGTVTKRSSGQYTASNKITGPITIPSSLPPGSYYVKIFVGEPTSRLNPNNAGNSTTFTVNAPATVVISDAIAGGVTVNPGQVAPVKLTFGGAGVFTFNYDDLRNPGFTQTVSVPTAGSTTINLYPTSTYTFDASKLINFRGACDNGVKSGQATITVNSLTVKTTSSTSATVCPNKDPITVSFTVSGTPPSGTKFLVQISDRNGNFQSPNTSQDQDGNLIGSGTQSPITCSVGRPISTYATGTNYKVRVISENGTIRPDGSSANVELRRPTFPAATPVTYCENAVPASIQPEGDIIWYNVFREDGSIYQSINAKVKITPPTSPGIYKYTWGRFDTGGCEAGQPEFVVTVNSKSAAPGNQTLEYCQSTGNQTLSINATNVTWYTGAGVAIGNQAPSISTDNTSPLSYKVTQNTNGCVSDQSTITVTIKAKPGLPTVTNPAALCQYGPSADLTASGDALQWYSNDDKQISNPVRPSTDVAGAQTYKVTQTKNGCTSDKATLTQTINPASDKPTFTTAAYCVNYPAQPLSARTQAQNPKWYFNGSEVPGSTVPPTVDVKTITYQLTQTQTGNNCPSQRVDVAISIQNTPTAPTVQSVQTVCQFTTPTPITVGGTNLVWKGTDVTDTLKTPIPATSTARTYSYTVTQKLGSCVSPASFITYSVTAAPPVPVAQATYLICIGQSLSLSATVSTAGNILKWYASSADASSHKNGQTSLNVPTQSATTASWYVTQTDSRGCESLSAVQTVTVSPQSTAKLTGDDKVIYDDNLHSQDSTAIRIQLGGTGPWNVTFWDSKSAVVNPDQNPYVKWVKLKDIAGSTPVNSQTTASFALKALSGQCGAGVLPGAYTLTVQRLVTDIEPLQAGLSLMVLPNPAATTLQVEWQAKPRQGVTLRVLNSSGRVIWQGERVGSGGVQIESLPVSNWSSGQYYVQMAGESGNLAVRKLIKQ